MHHSNSREHIARMLLAYNMILTKPQSPGGKGFHLKLHDKNPNAPLSPYYVNLRLLRSFPPLLHYVAESMLNLTFFKNVNFELIADVPTAGTPIVTLMADISEKPMISPREPKNHGTQTSIDGVYKEGQSVLLVDDLVTGANSLLASAKILREAGLSVTDVAVLIDREQGGEKKLAFFGLNLRAVWTITDLLAFYDQEGLIDTELVAEINVYRASVA